MLNKVSRANAFVRTTFSAGQSPFQGIVVHSFFRVNSHFESKVAVLTHGICREVRARLLLCRHPQPSLNMCFTHAPVLGVAVSATGGCHSDPNFVSCKPPACHLLIGAPTATGVNLSLSPSSQPKVVPDVTGPSDRSRCLDCL